MLANKTGRAVSYLTLPTIAARFAGSLFYSRNALGDFEKELQEISKAEAAKAQSSDPASSSSAH